MKRIIFMSIAGITMALQSFAQSIPNNGFENWTNMSGYNNPDNWGCLNDLTASMSVFTCVKGSPGVVGNSYIKLTSKTVTGLGVVPGLAVSGTIDMTQMQAGSGFAFTDRPEIISGKWQYMAYGTDQGYIALALTRWNNNLMQRDTVGMCYYALPGMVMTWGNFSIPITYLSGDDPDSCIIVLSASQAYGAPATANSYLYVDEVGFSGFVAGVSSPENENVCSVSPNPAINSINLLWSVRECSVHSIEIHSVLGKFVKRICPDNNISHTQVDISDLENGIYILTAESDSGMINKRIIKQ